MTNSIGPTEDVRVECWKQWGTAPGLWVFTRQDGGFDEALPTWNRDRKFTSPRTGEDRRSHK
jgi:hypothetical protein